MTCPRYLYHMLHHWVFEVIATPQEFMFNDATPVKRQDGIGGSRLFYFFENDKIRR